MFGSVQSGDVVLLLWADLGQGSDHFQATVTQIQAAVGEGIRVQ